MNLKTKLTIQDKKFCEDWLVGYTYVIRCLKDTKEFTEGNLIKLIKYEATTRQRDEILRRMTGRYNKLRRKREWIELQKFIMLRQKEGV